MGETERGGERRVTRRRREDAVIEALRQELAATNVLLSALGGELSASRVETAVRVEGLRAEQHRERRVRMMGVAAGGLTLLAAHDEHIEHCSPGARATRAIDELIEHPPAAGHTPPERQKLFEEAYNHAPTWCDVTFPAHTHDGGMWPSAENLAGGLLIVTVIAAVWLYHRWRTRQDFARVARAAQAEETHADPESARRS